MGSHRRLASSSWRYPDRRNRYPESSWALESMLPSRPSAPVVGTEAELAAESDGHSKKTVLAFRQSREENTEMKIPFSLTEFCMLQQTLPSNHHAPRNPDTSTVIIETASKADLAPIMEWLRNERRHGTCNFYGNRWTIRDCAAKGMLLVIRADHKVVGFAALYVGEIWLFEIKPSQRGRGYGKLLADASIEALRAKGCRQVCVECEPFTSQPFWKARGFDCSQDFGRKGCLILN